MQKEIMENGKEKKKLKEETAHPIIKKFLDNYSKKSTRGLYRVSIEAYAKYLKLDLNTYFKDKERDFNNDIKTYSNSLQNRPKKTKSSYTWAVIKFLKCNNISITENTKDNLKRECKGSAISNDRIPTIEEIKMILNGGNFRFKTMTLALLSSGVRINELCTITDSNITFSNDTRIYPTKIFISGEYSKNKESRIVFVSAETDILLKQWLTIRKNKPNDKRFFQIDNHHYRKQFNRVIKHLKLDKRDIKTHRYELHPHVFRKFFETKLSNLNKGIISKLLGHSGYLNEYLKISEEELAKIYLENEHLLTINNGNGKTIKQIKELEGKIENKGKEIEIIVDKQKEYEELLIQQKQQAEEERKTFQDTLKLQHEQIVFLTKQIEGLQDLKIRTENIKKRIKKGLNQQE